MHFKILKMTATSGFLTVLECTKFVFGRGSAPDPAGELTALPRSPSWIKGALILKRKGGEGRRGRKEGDGRGGEGRREGNCRKKGKKGEGTAPAPFGNPLIRL